MVKVHHFSTGFITSSEVILPGSQYELKLLHMCELLLILSGLFLFSFRQMVVVD